MADHRHKPSDQIAKRLERALHKVAAQAILEVSMWGNDMMALALHQTHQGGE